MRAAGVCTIEQQYYLLRHRPGTWKTRARLLDSEAVLHGKKTYMLLLRLSQTLAIMHEKGKTAHGSITLDSILSESSILEFSAFWLIGLSASTDSADELRAAQAQDVQMVLHLVKSATRDQDGLVDPIIGPLLREICSKAESGDLSAADAFTAFNSALGSAAVRSPFWSVRFQKSSRLDIVGQTYFLKRELVAVA